MADVLPAGLLGEFGTPERLVIAARLAREAEMPDVDAFTPFPVDELNLVLRIRDHRVPWLAVIGGFSGLVAAYAMQIATNLNFPLDIGGRPLIALQAFALIGFELTVLFSVGFMFAGFLILNRLPRYHRPQFYVDRFEHATRDGFFLFVGAGSQEKLDAARGFLTGAGALTIDEVPR